MVPTSTNSTLFTADQVVTITNELLQPDGLNPFVRVLERLLAGTQNESLVPTEA